MFINFRKHYRLSKGKTVNIAYIFGYSEAKLFQPSGWSSSLKRFLSNGSMVCRIFFITLLVWYFKFRKPWYILKDGTVVAAVQISLVDTGSRIDESLRYELTYTYQANGQSIEIFDTTDEPEEKDESEKLVYSNRDPSKFVWLDDLPLAVAERLASL